MNVADLLIVIGGLGNAIMNTIDRVQGNKAQCERLSHRINIIITELKSLDLAETSKYFLVELFALKEHIEKCQIFIKKFTQKGKFMKWLKSKKYQSYFDSLNRALSEDVNQLLVGVNIQEMFNHAEDRADKAKDMEYLETLKKQQEAILLQLEKGEKQLEEISEDQKEMLNLVQEWSERQVQLLMQVERGDKKLDQVGIGVGRILDIIQRKEDDTAKKYALIDASAMDYSETDLIHEDDLAKIYKGWWHGKLVAIKKFKDLLIPSAQAQFIREIQIMYRIHHEQILPLYSACVHRELECLIMPYMAEGSLTQYLAKKVELDIETQYHLALQIAQGLCYLHDQKIIHGDLCSSHILVDAQGNAKITGFRLARVTTTSIKSSHEISHARCYLAPEILQKKMRYTDKSDVYSYGILLCELFLGRSFWDEYTRMAIGEIEDTKSFNKKLISEINTKVGDKLPEFYHALILDCLNENASMRPHMNEILWRLKEYQAVILFDVGVMSQTIGDLRKARECYEQAAKKGYTRAKTNLAMLLLSSKDSARDKQRVYLLLKEAAEAGHARAQFNLGMMLEYGDGVPGDYHKAMMWYNRAAESGSKKALARRERLYVKMSK